MSKTIEFLESCTRIELAFFAYYKMGGYTSLTQDKIAKYFFDKHLTKQEILDTIEKHQFKDYSHFQCPRCGSKKHYHRDVEKPPNTTCAAWDLQSYQNNPPKETQSLCIVCDYHMPESSPDNGNKRSWLDRFLP